MPGSPPPASAAPSRAAVALALGAVYFIWGSTYLAIRVGVRTIPPFLLAAIRFGTAGALLYAIARRSAGRGPTRTDWKRAGITGALLLGGGNGPVVWAEKTIPSGLAALLVSTVPLWMAVIEWATGGRRPSPRAAGGLLLGFAGVAMLVSPSFSGGWSGGAGAAVVLLAAVSWAAGSTYSRRRPLSLPPLLGAAVQMIAGAGVLAAMSIASGELPRAAAASWSVESIAALVYLILFGAMIGFAAYMWVLGVARVEVTSTYAYVNPVVAVLLGRIVLKEPLGLGTVAAAAVILAGVATIVSAGPSSGRL